MELSESKATAKWSTQEELLLAFAVKRHGLKNWETVAMELQSRSNGTKKILYTAGICKKTYGNLRKRFVSDEDDDDGGGEGGEESFWWLEELRNQRVAELKMEVEGYDLSIESLQKKVKTMVEESGKSLHRNEIDLDEQKEAESLEEDKNNEEKAKTAVVAGNSSSGGDGNRSFNESNSTDNTRTGLANEPKPVEIKPNHETLKSVGEEDSDSCKDISDSKGREKDGVDSAKVVDSSSESRERSHGTKGSSDIQSSASQMTRRNKRISRTDKVRNGAAGGGDGGGVTTGSPATVPSKKGRGVGSKAEPIFDVLDDIRSHKHGGVFLHRLEIQKSRKYISMVRRHVDLETVQTRLENGSYSFCPAKIYVDLLLLCNNAIFFFPKSSSQSRVAHQLRQLVTKHIKKHSPIYHQPDPEPLTRPERSASLLQKQKSTAPIVVCKKRSSITSKPSSSSSISKIPNQVHNKSNDGAKKSNAIEKPVTGVRSVRKGINTRPPPPPPNSGEKPESSKASELSSIDKKKGAANFLKRIKNNEPLKKDQKTVHKNPDPAPVPAPRHRAKRTKEESSSTKTSDPAAAAQTSTKRIGRPPKKKKGNGKEVLKGNKRDRAARSEDEGPLKRPIKRSRR